MLSSLMMAQARIFTTLVLTKDPMLLASWIVLSVCNLVILVQVRCQRSQSWPSPSCFPTVHQPRKRLDLLPMTVESCE